MNERQRFIATMHYQPRDRSPIVDFGFWDETVEKWHDYGIPESIHRYNMSEFFGMDGLEQCDLSTEGAVFAEPKVTKRYPGAGIRVGLFPTFDEIVLEDRADEEVVQQHDGVRVLRKKFQSTIPLHQGRLLTDRDAWRKHYRPRLDPQDPRRLPADWPRFEELWRRDDRPDPVFLPGGSLYGWIRNWMGVEEVSYVIYDDPAWFEEMVETVADCIIGVLKRVLATDVRYEACGIWEDMCFNAGPLISPQHFKRFLVPQYRRITELLHSHGVSVVWVDCDGKIDELIPLWLEAGVNCMMPVEVGVWGGDPIEMRREFGKELLLMGGFDKRILSRTSADIEAEIHRLAPLVDEGGYIGFCDHRVPADVELANYEFYLETVRRVWGNDVNLRQMRQRPD
jgi:uroporphyrinogen decarboxylase